LKLNIIKRIGLRTIKPYFYEIDLTALETVLIVL